MKMQRRSKNGSSDSSIHWFRNAEHICWLILFLGFGLRILYAARVGYDYSPHDLGTFNVDGSVTSFGHLAYIQYIYLHRSIPTVCSGQFYHPPLFHLIGAFVLEIFHVMDAYDAAFEALQMINMFFSSVGILYGYRILKKVGKNDGSLIVGTAFLSFCPAFYIIGAELNNDCLVTVFMIMAVYYTICWTEQQSIGNILKIALCIGVGMLTKTTAVLLAFAIGLIFLYTLIRKRTEWKRYLKQYFFFGIVCVPLGLCWNIYRFIKYRISLTYIPGLSNESNQFVGNVSALKRLGLPSVSQLTSSVIDWDRPTVFSNIWGQTFLTMNYDEGILQIDGRLEEMLAVVLLWVSIFLSIMLLCLLLQNLFSSDIDVSLKILFPVNFLIIFGNYIKFAFDYPHICTMNFRYIVIVQVLLISGYVMWHRNHLEKRGLNRCVAIFVVVQSLFASGLYLFCAV